MSKLVFKNNKLITDRSNTYLKKWLSCDLTNANFSGFRVSKSSGYRILYPQGSISSGFRILKSLLVNHSISEKMMILSRYSELVFLEPVLKRLNSKRGVRGFSTMSIETDVRAASQASSQASSRR